ncbi:MAG: hypothetical protein D3917_07895 [Candidatus Electrothrix sp. AX5]|nr:hypothetical protein [Candidatus Electrothrix sp. AX5]
MLYTIVQSFSPDDGEKWTDYCQWRGIEFERFDSIDGIMRPNLMGSPDQEDWPYIVHEDYMLHFMTDLRHGYRKLDQKEKGVLIGVKLKDHEPEHPDFLGYDIEDTFFGVSLLTNWGSHVTVVNESLSLNGLVLDIDTVKRVHQYLKSNYSDDDHVRDTRIISLYKVPQTVADEKHSDNKILGR